MKMGNRREKQPKKEAGEEVPMGKGTGRWMWEG